MVSDCRDYQLRRVCDCMGSDESRFPALSAFVIAFYTVFCTGRRYFRHFLTVCMFSGCRNRLNLCIAAYAAYRSYKPFCHAGRRFFFCCLILMRMVRVNGAALCTHRIHIVVCTADRRFLYIRKTAYFTCDFLFSGRCTCSDFNDCCCKFMRFGFTKLAAYCAFLGMFCSTDLHISVKYMSFGCSFRMPAYTAGSRRCTGRIAVLMMSHLGVSAVFALYPMVYVRISFVDNVASVPKAVSCSRNFFRM